MNNRNIDITSLYLQLLSLMILFKDFNNSDLMQELKHQNKDYLEKIINQNYEIINLLKGDDENGRRGSKEND